MYSSLKHFKTNITVEVVTERLELFRISKTDILYFFDGTTSKQIESLKGIDNAQQINLMIKIRFIEQNLGNWDSLSKLEFFESNPIISSVPEIIRENHGLHVLRDSSKAQDNTKKLEDLKSKLTVGKKDDKPIGNLDALNKLKGLSTLTSTDLNKNIALGTNRLGPKLINKSGLTENQIASKNKLEMFSTKKIQSEEEISEALKRINEKKKGDGSVSKLLAGLEPKAESVTFDELSKKLAKVHISDEAEPTKDAPKNEDLQNELVNLVTKKQSRDNFDHISNLDQKQLFRRTDSIKIETRKSDKNLASVD